MATQTGISCQQSMKIAPNKNASSNHLDIKKTNQKIKNTIFQTDKEKHNNKNKNKNIQRCQTTPLRIN